jgi:hypothetical protein
MVKCRIMFAFNLIVLEIQSLEIYNVCVCRERFESTFVYFS